MHKSIIASLIALQLIQEPVHADSGYNQDFIEHVELVYGDGYLSQGGSTMVDRIFEGIFLDGKKVLDLGCGVGGPALHLIQNHAVEVTGIDPEPYMINQCLSTLEDFPPETLLGTASFVLMEDPLSLREFDDDSFDIVTSKEALLHVPHEHKDSYFREIFRVLKPGGQLTVMDWLHTSPNYSAAVLHMMEMDGVAFNLCSAAEYQQTLDQAKFSSCSITDLTIEFAAQTDRDLATIGRVKDEIIERFGQEAYDYACSGWSTQAQAFRDRELLVCHIKAQKPQN